MKELRAYYFSKRVLFSIFPLHFEIQKVYLSRVERENNLTSFETSRLNSTGTFGRSEYAQFMRWIQDRAVHKDIYYAL